MTTETIRYEKDDEGIVTLTMDDPAGSANTMRNQFVDDYESVARQLEDEGAEGRHPHLREGHLLRRREPG